MRKESGGARARRCDKGETRFKATGLKKRKKNKERERERERESGRQNAGPRVRLNPSNKIKLSPPPTPTPYLQYRQYRLCINEFSMRE
jgi:hypothetical protein